MNHPNRSKRSRAVYFYRPVTALPVWLANYDGHVIGNIRKYGQHGYVARCEGIDIGGENIPSLRGFARLSEAKATITAAMRARSG